MAHQDFERYADEKRFAHGASSLWNSAFIEFTSSTGKPLSEIRFLDYGCGDGKYFQHLCDLGLHADNIHGVELSRKRVERCHSIGFQNAIQLLKDEELPYSDHSFDVINLMEVIEHIPRSRVAVILAEIRRVLAPQGFLQISTPNYPIKRFYDLFDAFFHGKWSRLRDDPTHIAPYSYLRIRNLLEAVFGTVVDRPYKSGFLYRFLPHPALMHKSFFVCHGTPLRTVQWQTRRKSRLSFGETRSDKDHLNKIHGHSCICDEYPNRGWKRSISLIIFFA